MEKPTEEIKVISQEDILSIDIALERIFTNAVQSEEDGHGLRMEFEWLRQCGALAIVLPGKMLDFNNGNMSGLLALLQKVGKANLSVGRIFEGHINTLYLIHLYATPEQKEKYYNGVIKQGHLFGIWNTQDHQGTKFYSNSMDIEIRGSKTFCSGALIVDRALITGDSDLPDANGWQMAIVEMDKLNTQQIRKDTWTPLGMKATGSFKVDFSGYRLSLQDLLASPGCYLSQPHFSAGAIRFAAVQLGGAERICAETISYLQKLDRTKDVFQSLRIAKMMSSLISAVALLEASGKNYDSWINEDSMGEALINFANLTRVTIEDKCLEIMQESNRCVGARGLMKPGTLERSFRDLTFYLRQPAPDATRVNIGSYFLENSF